MTPDTYMPLSKAAKIFGVTTKTARIWFEQDCGLVFKRHAFRRTLVSQADVDRVIKARTGERKYPRAIRSMEQTA